MSSVHRPSRRPGLGRGLDALFERTEAPSQPPAGEMLLSLPVDCMQPNPQQPRTLFPPQELEALATSIRQSGLLQPVVVHPHPEQSGQYLLIAGERRWRSAQMAGLQSIPALVRHVTPAEALVLSLAENIQRAALSPVEQAMAFDHLAEAHGFTHAQIATAMGMSRAAVTNLIRLLRLPEAVREALATEQITAGHARALLALPDLNDATQLVQQILASDLTVRQTEALVRNHASQAPSSTAAPNPAASSSPATPADPELQFLERQLGRHYQTKVQIQRKTSGAGRLTLHFYTDDGLNQLLALLLDDPQTL